MVVVTVVKIDTRILFVGRLEKEKIWRGGIKKENCESEFIRVSKNGVNLESNKIGFSISKLKFLKREDKHK